MTLAAASLPPAPLSDERKTLLSQLVTGLDHNSLWWLSGYAAGLAQTHLPPQLAVIPGGQAATEAPRLTIVYGSQTGNAKRTAEQLAAEAEAAGATVRLLRADTYPTRELVKEQWLYVVISTQGEGDPPDDSMGFVEFLQGRRAPKLPDLKFAVLGLGDSSYVDFCGIARKLDARLAELGAQRIHVLGEADVDVDTVATPWRAQAIDILKAEITTTPAASGNVTPLRQAAAVVAQWSQSRPFQAEVLANQVITGREFKNARFGAYGTPDKTVRHIELLLEDSGLHYEPGDALGIIHRNPASLVEQVLDVTGLNGDQSVTIDDQTLPLAQWLTEKRELTRIGRPFLGTLAERHAHDSLNQVLAPDNKTALAELFDTHQLIDVLRRWPAEWNADALVAALRPATVRLYSIASSRKRVGDEVHLCVDELRYHAHGHEHVGAASHFLAALEEGDSAPVYVEANERFRVPADASRDIIMIGPGTGVAPFRGFVQERAETGAAGRNWLFFGARHFNTDFLYQTEWQEALGKGELHRLDLAFSRDQEEKIYVQQRLRENARDVYDWLQNGAHLYVCGAIGMSKDVHAALLDIITQHNGGNAETAAEYLSTLQREGRYARDVY